MHDRPQTIDVVTGLKWSPPYQIVSENPTGNLCNCGLICKTLPKAAAQCIHALDRVRSRQR